MAPGPFAARERAFISARIFSARVSPRIEPKLPFSSPTRLHYTPRSCSASVSPFAWGELRNALPQTESNDADCFVGCIDVRRWSSIGAGAGKVGRQETNRRGIDARPQAGPGVGEAQQHGRHLEMHEQDAHASRDGRRAN